MNVLRRLEPFIYSRRNIAGGVLALGGLALFALGITSGLLGLGLVVALYGDCSDRFGQSELAEDTAGCDFLRTRTNGPGETRCVFLRGTLGEAVACTAYERRPQVCRDLEAGSPECLSIRAKRFPLP